jgi:plastocyanin
MKQKNTRWLSVILIVILAFTLACQAGAPRGENEQPGISRNEDVGTLDVVLDDFSISFDQPLEAGTISFVIRNEGSTPHDFAIRGEGVDEKTPMIQPGEEAALTVCLEPGSYDYICTVMGHEQLGMRGTLEVE